MSFNLATILRESAIATPDKAAMLFAGTAVSYAELEDQSARFAAGLTELGMVPGDVVALQLPNVPQFLVAYFGTVRAGMVLLPLNPLLKAPEIEYHVADAGAKVLITFDMVADEAIKGAGDAQVFVLPVTGAPLAAEVRPMSDLMAPAGDVEELYPTEADDTAVLIYTSGTTGKPKGAELTHFQLYMNCTTAGGLFGALPDDITLAVLPFFHVFGLSSVLNVTLRYGGTLSVVPRFEPGPVLDAVERDRCTVICGVPTMLQALTAQDTTGRDLSALRIAVSGGASLPGPMLAAFEDKFGIVVLEGYGLSETASTASFNTSAENRKVLSIGKPIWGVQMRVVDADDKPLPVGPDHIGEIVIRGHNVMKGYLGLPEVTAAAFRGGWFHSGDLGYVDEDGFYFIVDRSKDLVIRGGYNVYPREVEEVLYTHPDIAEAAVIGKPDDRLGEEVVAVVARKPDTDLSAEDVIAFCKERMAAYKYPREVRFVPSLPKGPTGKILKSDLRAATG
ncbi:long-chain-fatty-acid--CoA ligase [Actinokineospora sp.]|uniref:long-chain-fatty-acid--CoA ligase n=1 Tax=Actinokineospora sp. TaxID=1872133 RepID=UPI004037AEFE